MKRMIFGGAFFTVLSVAAVATFADSTIIKNPGLVAPFNLCLIHGGQGTWAATAFQKMTQPYVTGPQAIEIDQEKKPLCFTQKTTVTDFAAMTPFEKDFFVAVASWQYYWKTTKTININVQVDSADKRFGGQSVDGTHIPFPVGTASWTRVQPATLSKILGKSSGAVDVNVYINQPYGAQNYCFDTTPTQSKVTCDGSTASWDVTSVLTHELGHGYGFWSRRNGNNPASRMGQFTANTINTFDYFTNNVNKSNGFSNDYNTYFKGNQHLILFTGTNTIHFLNGANPPYTPPAPGTGWPSWTHAYKSLAPKAGDAPPYGAVLCNLPSSIAMSSQNFSHFGTSSPAPASGNVVTEDLMSLWQFWPDSGGVRLGISSLDLNVMKDMGYPLKTTTALSTAAIRTTLFNNSALMKVVKRKKSMAKHRFSSLHGSDSRKKET